MSAAAIVFADIVGFSRKPSGEQRHLIEELTSEVVHELRVLLNPPMEAPSVLAMPTGDGMALAFLHKPNQVWNRATLLRLIFRLHKWANERSTALRIGIHTGAVQLVTDINGRPNVAGDTVNLAQRVMDAANPHQTLFSEAAFHEYVGVESPTLATSPFSQELKAEFLGPVQVHAKHGLQILVCKLTLHPVQEWWCNDDPSTKDMMVVSLTPLPKEIVGSFGDRVGGATEVAFIQLTGDRLLTAFKEQKIKLSQQLKRLWALMPDPEVYSQLHLSPPHASTEYVAECVAQWRAFLGTLRTGHPNADLKLGLFREPPYLGASFIDWERPGGTVHVSPYVWSVPAPECPGYDLQWLGEKPPSIYEVYVQGLRYLHSRTTNAAFS